MSHFHLIAFDADDTLWHNERLYVAAQQKFQNLLGQYHSPAWVKERLYQTEMRNLGHYGYGIKSFALSMIETAVELTEGRITGSDILELVNIAKEMLASDVELLEQVPETLGVLAETHPLLVITKGDLHDQETKIARSGLANYFQHVEIVSDKSAASYSHLIKRYNVVPEHFLMVGNSLRSDILPVLEIGATAVYIPHLLTWEHEAAEPPPPHVENFFQIEHIGMLPELVQALEQARTGGER